MPPLVVDVMNAHKAALLRREEQQMRAMAQRWRQVERALQAEVLRFTQRLQQEGLTIGQIQSRQFQLERFSALLTQARREMDKYTNDYALPLIAQRQQEMVAAGVSNATAAIEAVGEQNGIVIKFDRLPVEAIENMVALASEGSPLRTLLRGSYGAGAEGMFNRLINGVALGKNPRVIARSMVRDGLSQSLTRMMVVARTEQLRVYRESSRQTYMRSGVVEGYKRLATHDRRTCPACLMADGQFYELQEVMEEHPAGRCAMLPVVKGLPPVTWQEGPEWFVEQPADVQRDILGPGRFDAWRQGRFDLAQLVSRRTNPVWGDSLQPTALRDLLNGTAQPATIRRSPSAPEQPQAPVVASPASATTSATGPAGRPVSAALQLPARGKLAGPIRETVAAIDSVHGDGALPDLPVLTGSMKNLGGYYKANARTGAPIEIKISTSTDAPRIAMAHELGHFIEKQALGSAVNANPAAATQIQKLKAAFGESMAIKRIGALLRGDELIKVNIGGGVEVERSGDMKYLIYLKREEEVWARAYSQYIAIRSGDTGLMKELRREQQFYYPTQWADDDFEPIAAAIDNLFTAVGWMK